MDEEQFELMYKFPGADEHIPLPAALDYLYLHLLELEEENTALKERVSRLSEHLTNLQFHVDTLD